MLVNGLLFICAFCIRSSVTSEPPYLSSTAGTNSLLFHQFTFANKHKSHSLSQQKNIIHHVSPFTCFHISPRKAALNCRANGGQETWRLSPFITKIFIRLQAASNLKPSASKAFVHKLLGRGWGYLTRWCTHTHAHSQTILLAKWMQSLGRFASGHKPQYTMPIKVVVTQWEKERESLQP